MTSAWTIRFAAVPYVPGEPPAAEQLACLDRVERVSLGSRRTAAERCASLIAVKAAAERCSGWPASDWRVLRREHAAPVLIRDRQELVATVSISHADGLAVALVSLTGLPLR